MKLPNSLQILLFFLCTITLIACSSDEEDEKTADQLELSSTSCKVEQWCTGSIKLTAHENTRITIQHPELIDAVYTWKAGHYKSEIEIKGKEIGETSIAVADQETGQTVTLKVTVTEYPMPRIGVKTADRNIFDLLEFYLYHEKGQPVSSGDIAAVCDSMLWSIEGENSSYRIFLCEKGDGGLNSSLMFSWGHCFKYPGEYNTHLTAWKDNKVIYRFPFTISIADNKDFLGFNWNEITESSQVWDGYTDVFENTPNLITSCGLNQSVPYVEVRVLNSNLSTNLETLYTYFTKLYGEPTYKDSTEKQNMWKLYDELFSDQKSYPNAYPIAIWVTARVHVVLVDLDDDEEDYSLRHAVYAEPRN